MRIVTLANKNTDMYLQRVKIQMNQGKDQKKKCLAIPLGYSKNSYHLIHIGIFFFF